ncbi:hypothetical protein [Actinokineospora globicatena]|uniref:hypothetical protein n=1 Tax=Actinokineospora globicatena TaxID=103729 RepID=UPI0020A35BF9|nr:hypothetical protein [Actinokineospora globicatena]MCP2304031.1 hypothetical protein [Actinokineospora globicatena]
MQTPMLDVYTKLTDGCSMSYESIGAGETEFTLGGAINGALVLTFTGAALRDFLALATEALDRNTKSTVDASSASEPPTK